MLPPVFSLSLSLPLFPSSILSPSLLTRPFLSLSPSVSLLYPLTHSLSLLFSPWLACRAHVRVSSSSSSLHKPLVSPSVSPHFPHTGPQLQCHCAQLKFQHLFSLQIRLLVQIYTNLLNLSEPLALAIQTGQLFV